MIKVLSFFLHPIALTVLGLAALFGLVFFGGRALREQQLIALTDWQLALIFSAAASLLLLLILWIRYRALRALRADGRFHRDGDRILRNARDRRPHVLDSVCGFGPRLLRAGGQPVSKNTDDWSRRECRRRAFCAVR